MQKWAYIVEFDNHDSLTLIPTLKIIDPYFWEERVIIVWGI